MKIDRKQRIISFCVCLLLVALLVIMNFVYRPYIYQRHIYDFHLADTFSNLLGVPLAIFLGIALSKELNHKFSTYISAVCSGLIFYECFLGLYFDFYDIIATIISGFVTLKMLRFFFKCNL